MKTTKTNIDEYISNISNFNIIEINDIPGIDLYMDQVTTFIDDRFKCFKRFNDDKILTKTMINNYAKARILPAPIKKKYTKNHIMLLILIYHLKFILSISDISKFLGYITKDIVMDKRCVELENIYSNFIHLQKMVKNNLAYSLEDALNDDAINNSNGKIKIDMQFITTILYLSIEAGTKRRIAETILDNNS